MDATPNPGTVRAAHARTVAFQRQVRNAQDESYRRMMARRRGYHGKVFTRNDLAATVARNTSR